MPQRATASSHPPPQHSTMSKARDTDAIAAMRGNAEWHPNVRAMVDPTLLGADIDWAAGPPKHMRAPHERAWRLVMGAVVVAIVLIVVIPGVAAITAGARYINPAVGTPAVEWFSDPEALWVLWSTCAVGGGLVAIAAAVGATAAHTHDAWLTEVAPSASAPVPAFHAAPDLAGAFFSWTIFPLLGGAVALGCVLSPWPWMATTYEPVYRMPADVEARLIVCAAWVPICAGIPAVWCALREWTTHGKPLRMKGGGLKSSVGILRRLMGGFTRRAPPVPAVRAPKKRAALGVE